jgi:phage N-6-adenine-methyltransferase
MQFVQRSKKDVWQTPEEVTEPIADAHGKIDLDPCAGQETQIGNQNIRPPEDGLSETWNGVVFMNPPFSTKNEWLEKAVEESTREGVDTIYALTPDSTDTISWWHEYIAENATVTWFPRGRINYIDPDTGEQATGVSFGSAVSVFGNAPAELLMYWSGRGDLAVRPQNGEGTL